MSKYAHFSIYRLNIIDKDLLNILGGKKLRSDKDISWIISEAAHEQHDIIDETKKSLYIWSLRHFIEKNSAGSSILGVILSKSIAKREGEIVTKTEITSGLSEFSPPPADSISIYIFLDRHLVAVEKNSKITNSNKWQKQLSRITDSASKIANFDSFLSLEERPDEKELMNIFRSFSTLTRLRVNLRLPNPELTRYSKKLYDDLLEGGIREYLQDMKNPNGLSTELGKRPHATLEVAKSGYKDGAITFAGIKGGKREEVVTGEKAIVISSRILKERVRNSLVTPDAGDSLMVFNEIKELLDAKIPRDD